MPISRRETNTITRYVLLIACALLRQVAPCQDQPSFTVRGLGARTVVVTGADLAGLPQHAIRTAGHGKPAAFQGVLLTDVLAKVDLPVGDKYHSTAASYYLLAEGKDGYRALYAWAELDSEFMDKPVHVVTQRGGKALPERSVAGDGFAN